MDPISQQFFVNDYQLAALEWNSGARHRVLACHGWLDNAASFERLAPLLKDCHVVALDMPGHGHSDHKSRQATYNIWDDLRDILAVADTLGWQQFHLLGHSRGAIMSMLLATAIPQRILSLLMLDGLVPVPTPIAETASQLGQFLKDYSGSRQKSHPGFSAIDDAVNVRRRAVKMSEESARPIVERGLIESEGRYYWRSDPRLLYASAFKLSHEHNQALLNALLAPEPAVPHLLLLSSEGILGSDYFQQLLTANPALRCDAIAGSHHFHMEHSAAEIARCIHVFLASELTAKISRD